MKLIAKKSSGEPKAAEAESDHPPESGFEPSRYSVLETEDDKSKLGTYLGVFRPTVLTIFGVIMYIRMGWVVGNAGLLGALLILFMTFLITGTAALSFSSITTNIRLKAGGVFALVSQSLGLEAGGAIGLPLFLAQSMGAALYIYGFKEGWMAIFPDHSEPLVIGGIFATSMALTLFSEKLALRLQVIVMIGVVVALVSMIGGFWTAELHEPKLWGEFKDGDLWLLFAVFFPAGTGIKVGASLSGKLRDPRRSIPLGVLSAWGTALITYIILMIWYSMTATPDQLTGNYMIATENAWWGKAVLIGLLSSCASATLSSMIAAPNVLAALAQHSIIPKAKFLAKQSKGGTHRNAALFNSCIVGFALLLGDLNRVAQLITMFFLITYATINIVVLIEQSLGLLSFRPTFKVPLLVPITGAVTSVFAMVIINPVFGLMALGVVVALYIYLERRDLETPWETVRSGMLLGLADWAARQAQKVTGANERAWKPDLMVPVDSLGIMRGQYRLLLDLLRPKGSLQVLYKSSANGQEKSKIDKRLREMVRDYQRENLFATYSIIDTKTIPDLVHMGASVMQGSFFKPNILFINPHGRTDQEMNELVELAKEAQMGVAILMMHEEARLSRERDINIWIRDQSPDWTLGLRLANLDLALLLGYQLKRNWSGQMRLLSAISDSGQLEHARVFLERLFKDARMPGDSSIWVRSCSFGEALTVAPKADLNIFGLGQNQPLSELRRLTEKTSASCLFVIDSGLESALA